MRIRQLEYFVVICEAGSFSRAAQRLFVAQPSLSQQIKALEAELKVQLLDRSGHSVHPTAAGQLLLAEAKVILAAVERAEHLMRDYSDERRGDIQVLAVRSIATGVLPPAVKRWHDLYPDTVLTIRDFPYREAMEMEFNDGHGDVAVGPRMDVRSASHTTLGYEEIVLAAPADSGLRPPAHVTMADLESQRWILFDRRRGLTRPILELCQKSGFDPIVAVWTGHAETALKLAEEGVGITLVPDNSIPGNAQRRHLNSLRPPVFREICAVAREPVRAISKHYIDVLSTSPLPLIARSKLPSDAIIV